MYILRQTTQSPLQFNWCGNGLQGSTTTNPQSLWNSVGTTPVYVSAAGTSPSVYTNQKGTLTYVFTKSGATTGTSSGTATSTTSFTDTKTGINPSGVTNYNLTITDANTGQSYTYLNALGWGAV